MTSPGKFRRAEGGLIDRSQPVGFQFNGSQYTGFAGDTLASALLANDVKVVSRSFKFRRPRGILSAGVEEPNALLGVDYGSGMIPIVRATLMPLLDGLKAESQTGFPSVGFDLGRVLDYTRVLWPAGFYNKMFKWPSWHTYEGAIRNTAGIGKLPDGEDSTRYRHANRNCDVLIVGAGPAGIEAALEAARSGKDILLAEQDTTPGGSALFDAIPIDGQPAATWLQDKLDELSAFDNVRLMLQSTVVGYYDHNVLTIHDRSAAYRAHNNVETFWKIRAGQVVLATGAIEQPLMFGNNDLPGIMLASAVHAYAGRYAVNCGDRVVGVTNNDAGWRTLLATSKLSGAVAAIVDARDAVDSALTAAAEELGIDVHLGATVSDAAGDRRVKALRFKDKSGQSRQLDCDVVAMSGGLNPTVHLYSQAGGKLRYDDALACFLPDHCRQHVTVVGAASGDFATAEEYNIGRRVAAPGSARKQWIDFQHDVTVSDIELAVSENYLSVEHLKRYTTTGMAVDQGKTSNLNALTLLGELTDRPPGQVGTTTFRPQFMPVTMGAIAGNRRGDFYAPPRLLAAHDWHVERGAVFDDYGAWKRPAYYGGDRDQSVMREAAAVRESAGLFDGSPLGKIEVKGPDAAELLNRVYMNTVPTLKVGKVRYGLMLTENGIVMDDGVFVRLADDHFLVNSTSGNADRVVAWLEEWHQCEWPDLDVVITPVSSQWSVATIAGPRSRDILKTLDGLIPLDTETFPHMSFASGTLADGTPYRLQRVSFTGEISFELSVPSESVTRIFDALWQAGSQYNMTMLGVEALMVLRTEKGYLHVGVDTDGTTNPLDLGFAGIVARKQTDFVGARSLKRNHDTQTGRRQLVGLEANNGKHIHAGAHFVTANGSGQRSEGFVTSAYVSPVLGKCIGLGLLENGHGRKGEQVRIFDEGQVVSATIVDPCFVDSDSVRLRA